MNLNEMIDVDLPSLQSIQLGYNALCGKRDDDSSSLTLRSNIELILNDLLCRSSKSNINQFSGILLLQFFNSNNGKYFLILNIDCF